MLVQEVMSKDVVTCGPDSSLGTVAKLMRDFECGFLPVINSHGMVVGVVTDRDLGIAVGASLRAAERIAVDEVMSAPVYACFANENLKAVLATMSTHHVRRLPVLDKEHGQLHGIVSLDDIVKAPHRRGSPTSDEILDAFKRIVTRPRVESVTA